MLISSLVIFKGVHSLMEDGIHDFCEIQVLFKGTEIFLLFLRG